MRANQTANAAELADEIDARIRALPRLKTEAIRAVRRQFTRRLSKSPPRFVVEVAEQLMRRTGIEQRFAAYELIHHHGSALASLGSKDLVRLGRGLDSWGAVDMFACYLSGPAWRERQVPDRLIHRWARSNDRWRRRAALVSTVPLNTKARGGNGDTTRTLQVCEMLTGDRDDMVVKAMSWALRELSKRNPKAVERFVAKHRNQLASRVIREVENKLATGLKNPRLVVDR